MCAYPRPWLPVVVTTLFVAITAASSARAATVNVDVESRGGACSDNRTSTQAQNAATPWCTLSKALGASPDGSTIQVRGGTYPPASSSDRHLTSGISVSGYPREQPVLQSLSLARSDGFAFSGLTLQAAQLNTTKSISFTGDEVTGGGLFATAAPGLLIQSTVFHDGYDALVVRRSSNVNVLGNVFRDMPMRDTTGGDGIQAADNTGLTVRGNTFLRISNPLGHCDSIQLLGANDYATIDGNLFRSARGPIVESGTGRAGALTRHLAITNNEMTQMTDWALNIGNAPDAMIVNNTIWNAAHGIKLSGTYTRASLYDNIVSRLEPATGTIAAEAYNLIANGPTSGARDIRSGDPRFMSQTQPDYHLTAGSPAVDAGSNAFAPALDRDGRQRVGAPDLGAYEFQP
jgi:hypothetical protein